MRLFYSGRTIQPPVTILTDMAFQTTGINKNFDSLVHACFRLGIEIDVAEIGVAIFRKRSRSTLFSDFLLAALTKLACTRLSAKVPSTPFGRIHQVGIHRTEVLRHRGFNLCRP